MIELVEQIDALVQVLHGQDVRFKAISLGAKIFGECQMDDKDSMVVTRDSIARCYELRCLVDESKAVGDERNALINAAKLALVNSNVLGYHRMWISRVNKLLKRKKSLEQWTITFQKKFQQDRRNVATVLQRRLAEFTSEASSTLRHEFSKNDDLGIWNLSDPLCSQLLNRTIEFVEEQEKQIGSLFERIGQAANKIADRSIPVPGRLRVISSPQNDIHEDSAFDKVMDVNSKLRIMDMNASVMGIRGLGKWFGVGKAPQHVREQFVRQNQQSISNWLRQFASKFMHEFNDDCERFAISVETQMDTQIRSCDSRLGFMLQKKLNRSVKPVELNIDEIVRLPLITSSTYETAESLRKSLAKCYNEVISRSTSDAR